MRSRGIIVIIILLALASVAAAQSFDNLLISPSAEEGLKGWKMVSGNTWSVRAKDPKAADGYYYFYAGNDAATELHQTVDVSSLAPMIDAKRQVFEFSGWMYSYPVSGQKPDTAEIFVRYLN